MGDISIPLPVVLLGAVLGMTYGLLAVGLVVVYRSNRIVNFAQAEIGVFGASLLGIAVTRWNVPYYAALPLALLVGSGIAVVAEAAVVRRLRNAPSLMSVVATLGVGQFLVLASLVLSSSIRGDLFPEPSWLPEWSFGTLRITRPYTGMLLFAPAAVAAVALFLRKSRFGLALRCASANPEAARLSAIFAGRMSSLAWALAGALSTLTAVLVRPTQIATASHAFGPNLLLRALACAVIARMRSLPVALAAGIGLGIVEQVTLWNRPAAGLVEIVVFVAILGALLPQRRDFERTGTRGNWLVAQGWRPLPEAWRRAGLVRHGAGLCFAAVLAVAVALPSIVTSSTAITLVTIMCFTVVGLSVGVVSGSLGELSLGQFAVAAVGAVASYQVTTRVDWTLAAFAYAALAGAVVAVLLAVPALRVRGLMLTVTSLAFAIVTPAWLLGQPWAFAGGVEMPRLTIGSTELDTSKRYYWFALGVLVVATLLVRNVRRGAFGRTMVAVRDNEQNARAFGISATAVKLKAYALSGALAGVGGALFAHSFTFVQGQTFSATFNVEVVAMTVIGGLGIVTGPLLGAFYVVGIPRFFPLDSAGLAATAFGWLLLVLYLPGGIGRLAEPVRWRLSRWIARRAGVADEVPGAPDPSGALVPVPLAAASPPNGSPVRAAPAAAGASANGAVRRTPKPVTSVVLAADSLTKSYGGVTAVKDVSLDVRAGETLGLIGPNGAGKTTLFELLGGFTTPDAGHVQFLGENVIDLPPEQRAARGLIRSFQDAALFPTLTVLETLQLALERAMPSGLLRTALAGSRLERNKERRAREVGAFMGLEPYFAKQNQELSTGTRRITELACMVALEPRLLLLDEPASGVAQRETEALGAVLRRVKGELDATMVVIEHDIPLVMSLSDRLVAMETGSIICAGPPDEVRRDPRVVEAYLGGRLEAIERSGART